MTMRRILAPLFSLFLLCSCQSGSDNPQLESIKKELKKSLKEAKVAIDELGGDKFEATSEELEKLFAFEYKVFEADTKLGTGEMERVLGAFGKERWECFHAEKEQNKLRFFCKRRPKSYLRYIPKIL